jgi:hypothetical protein
MCVFGSLRRRARSLPLFHDSTVPTGIALISRRIPKVNFRALVVVLFLLTGGAAKASPISVDFSFIGDLGVPGLVTGELVFATAGSNVAATDVYVFTAPAGVLDPAQAGVDFAPFLINSPNSFTLSSAGVITSASLYVINSSATELLAFNNISSSDINFLNSRSSETYNYKGFTGITFTPANTIAVPEPSSLILLGGVLLTFGLVRLLTPGLAKGSDGVDAPPAASMCQSGGVDDTT